MKVSTQMAAGLAAVSFAVFYIFTLHSMLLPYAPSSIASYLPYAVFTLTVLISSYFGFVYRYKPEGKKGWMYQIKAPASASQKARIIFKGILSIAIFSGLMAYSTQRWLAVPTRLLAHERGIDTLNCIKSESWGKAFRGMVMVEAVNEVGDHFKFPWPQKELPPCPGLLRIDMNRWIFGAYIFNVENSVGG